MREKGGKEREKKEGKKKNISCASERNRVVVKLSLIK